MTLVTQDSIEGQEELKEESKGIKQLPSGWGTKDKIQFKERLLIAWFFFLIRAT